MSFKNTPNLLLTGFEPFAGRAGNPSAEIAARLGDHQIAGLNVSSVVLPVTNEGLRCQLIRHIKSVNPQFVLSLGLAAGESMIRIEKLAVNYSRFEIPDNAGEQIHGPVVRGGRDSYEATLPVTELQRKLLSGGIPARLSNSAGTYLCNALMYHALDYCANSGQQYQCGFVHLPYLPSQVCDQVGESECLNGRADLASMDLDMQVRAVTQIIQTLADHTAPDLHFT